MYGLSKEEKLNFILQEVEKNNISAYEISRNTNLTDAGVGRILNKTVKNPHENTLNAIIEFLFKKVKKGELKTLSNMVNEPKEDIYNEHNLEDLRDCLSENNKLTREIIKLQALLRKNNIKFQDFFDENK